MKYFFFLFFIYLNTFAQNDSINLLEEVKLNGHFSKQLNCGYHIKILHLDKEISTSQTLGDFLQKKANLYFKENGKGMVSSISLRGTGASHTGVYWNGIAINSALNGQTDFNTLSSNSFNQIEIRKGAGTTLLGSGAIGGAINLKDVVSFSNTKTLKAQFGLGSYQTKNAALQTIISSKKWYSKVSLEGNQSQNDYPFLETTLFNENGAYKNYHLKTVLGYKFNHSNQIKFFVNYSNNKRELSRTLSAPSKNLYKNTDLRLLLNWTNTGNHYTSSFNLASIIEDYQFYLDKNTTEYSFGKTNNYIAKYNFNYFIKKNQSVTIGLQNKFTQGEGYNIQKKERNNLEGFALYHQKINTKIAYNLSLRKGFSKVYQIPFIYAIDARYNLSKKINFRANYSTNYKLPSFNDLYWQGAGNEDLLPENSTSKEIGFYFNTPKFNLNLTAFQIDSENLIQWKPVSAVFWRPFNVQNVMSNGIEFEFDYKVDYKQHQFRLQTQYTYTNAVDKDLDKQLMYVPFHKLSSNLDYQFKGFTFNINLNYTGFAYTTTSNTQYIDEFTVYNVALSKNLYKQKINIGFKLNNVFNKAYQVVAFRPMPNRNYLLTTKLKL